MKNKNNLQKWSKQELDTFKKIYNAQSKRGLHFFETIDNVTENRKCKDEEYCHLLAKEIEENPNFREEANLSPQFVTLVRNVDTIYRESGSSKAREYLYDHIEF